MHGRFWCSVQGMVTAIGDLETLLFLHCSAAAILLASWDLAPLQANAHHFSLSIGACSQELPLMPKAFSDTLRVSLKHFFWPPRELFSCWSLQNKGFLGSRWSGIRTTWPAQRSWVCIKMVWMLERLAWVSTSMSGILSCHSKRQEIPSDSTAHALDHCTLCARK